MPPKRATRASGPRPAPVAGSDAGSARTHVTTSTESARLRGPVVSTTTPGPARFSTSYGSPATLVPRRYDVGRSSRNISGTLESVIDSVNEDNRNDARDRAQREAAEARRKNEVDRMRRVEEEDEVRRQREEAAAARLAEQQDQVDLIQSGGQDETQTPAQAQGKNALPRATSEEPSSAVLPQRQAQTSAGVLPSSGRRQFSEPPASTLVGQTARSFFEESHLYGDATLNTPLPSSRPAVKPLPSKAQLASLLGETPSRPDRSERADFQYQTVRDRVRKAPPPKPLLPLPELSSGSDSEEPQVQPPAKGTGRGTAQTRPRQNDPTYNPSSTDSEDEVEGQKSPPGPKTSRSKPSVVEETRSATSRLPQGRPQNKPASEPGARTGSWRDKRKESTRGSQWRSEALREALPQRRAASGFGLASLAGSNIWSKLATAISFLVLSWIALRVVVISTAPSAEYEGYRVDNRLRWYPNDWKSNVRQFVPYSLLHPLGAISDAEFNDINHRWNSHGLEIAGLRADQGVHKATLDKLEKILPSTVHVSRDKEGKMIIPDDFWHALRELVNKDVYNLQKARNGARWDLTEHQLKAVTDQLKQSGFKTDGVDGAEVENIVENAVPKAWESWAKDNSDKVKAVLGLQGLPDGNDEQSTEKIINLIKSKLDSEEFKDTVVSKDEFIRRLKEDIMVHRSEIKGEIAALEQELTQKIKAIAEASKPETITKKEARALVKQFVDHAIARSQLGSTSQARINAYYAENLDQEVNFFSKKTGAAIMRQFTSPDFGPRRPSPLLDSKAWLQGKPNSEKVHSVLQGWEEHGDCWCAGGKSPSFQVQLSHEIIPQHVVVEHIVASATLDPGAMPKDMEIWAHFEEYNMQKGVADWSATTFPDSHQDNELSGHGFIKIGEFKYENNSSRDRVQVYMVSPELEKMGAFTSSIVIKAVSNYGADDHTCFYRVKMYGEQGGIEKTKDDTKEKAML